MLLWDNSRVWLCVCGGGGGGREGGGLRQTRDHSLKFYFKTEYAQETVACPRTAT